MQFTRNTSSSRRTTGVILKIGLLLVLFLVKVMHDNVQYILNLKLIDPNFVVVVNAIGVATATTALEKISVVGTKINKYGM